MTRCSIAYFITHHGFGHATRSAAVMAALAARRADLHFDIFSRLPDFLFDQLLAGRTTIHPTQTDVGLIQKNALDVDLAASITALQAFYPLQPVRVRDLAAQVRALGCVAVLCDVTPLGIAVAQAAGVPSVLIENFTFSWIYEDFVAAEPRFEAVIATLADLTAQADHHYQVKPVSAPNARALTFEPTARPIRADRATQRAALGVAPERPLVMITMGGFGQDLDYLHQLTKRDDVTFVLPGVAAQGDNLICPQWRDNPYHPDLIAACDLVIGKLGYSTFAEVYHAGVPFAYIPRDNFRESVAIEAFILEHMPARAMRERDFLSGAWLDHLDDLLQLKPQPRPRHNGADQIATRLLQTVLPH